MWVGTPNKQIIIILGLVAILVSGVTVQIIDSREDLPLVSCCRSHIQILFTNEIEARCRRRRRHRKWWLCIEVIVSMLKVEFLFKTRLIIIMKINKNKIESLMSTANNYIKSVWNWNYNHIKINTDTWMSTATNSSNHMRC